LGREEGGLLSLADSFILSHRAAVIEAAARHKVPTIYRLPVFAREGGLMSYAPSLPDMLRGAAGYVDRILRGTRPADLPVQFPVKYEIVLNLRTAKALGIEVPPSILLSADEVIE
jgi:putative tryptophan/tyrosine transport system substrate-binding protein